MTEEELRSRIHHAVDSRLAGMQPDPGMLDRAVNGRGEGVMRKRIAFVPILLLVVALLSLSVAVAEELGFNLFPFLSGLDPRMEVLAPEAVLDYVDVVTFEHEKMGRVEAAISNARFNGETLLLTYYIKNGVVAEPFTPSEVFLAKMEKLKPEDEKWDEASLHRWDSMLWGTEAEYQLVKAVEEGNPIGFRAWNIDVGGLMTDADVIGEIKPSVGQIGRKDGVSYVVNEMEYDNILFVEGKRDEISAHVDLQLTEHYLYFDGTDLYYLAAGGQKRVGMLTATVQKSDMTTSTYTGAGTFMGVDFQVTGKTTEMTMELYLTMKEGEYLPRLPYYCQYVMYLTDEEGNFVNSRGYARGEASEEYIDFPSLGNMPEKLKLYIVPTCFDSLDEVFADPTNTAHSPLKKEDILDPTGLWVLNNGFDQLTPSAVLELEKAD